MKGPTSYTEGQLRVIRPIVEEIGERLRSSPHKEINVTISLKQLELKTGVERTKSFSIVRYFLESENKEYESKRSGVSGSRYFFAIKRNEYERWKKVVGLL
jgi:hypothetical protein